MIDIRWLPLIITPDMKSMKEIRRIASEKQIPIRELTDGSFQVMCDKKKYKKTLELFKK